MHREGITMTALRRLSVAFVLMEVGYVLDPHRAIFRLISDPIPFEPFGLDLRLQHARKHSAFYWSA
jgi:hypothetical protein